MQYLHAKAGIILECEPRMKQKQQQLAKENPESITKMFPKWLQVLKTANDDKESDSRNLSVTARVKTHVTAANEATQMATVESISAVEQSIMAKIEENNANMNAKIDAFNAKIDQLLRSHTGTGNPD